MARASHENGRKEAAFVSKPRSNVLDEPQLQDLNTQAFSDLSQKIQAQLSKVSQERPKEKLKRHGKPDTSRGEKATSKAAVDSPATKAHSRGKKRDSQGVVKEQGTSEAAEKAARKTATTKSVLEQEVYALGGTAEDFALVANLGSESELDEKDRQDKVVKGSRFEKGLKRGIADILKQIDDCGRPAAQDSDTEDGEGFEEGDEEEEGDHKGAYTAPFAGNTVVPKSRSRRTNFLISPRPDWYNTLLPPITNRGVSKSKILPAYVEHLHEHAMSLLNTENEAFKTSQQSSSSQNFYSAVIASGTLSDKISALTLAVQESPLHNTKALDTLVSLGKKRSRTQALDVLRALKDLFAQGSLLPNDRRLTAFSANSSILGALSTSKSWKVGDALPDSLQPQHMVFWAFESWLKEKYFEVLKILEIWCNDEIEFSKSRAVNFVYELLKEKPEQESNLLRLLTNKLGDPSKKIASQTSYLLMQLMAAHPLMKMTIISGIDSDFLFRPGQSLHAKYYAAITLNQTALSSKEEEVASKLLSIYFNLFIGLLKPIDHENRSLKGRPRDQSSRNGRKSSLEKHIRTVDNAPAEDLCEKLISAILTGINRAYPYTEANESLPTHLEALFKITHSSNFNTSIQAMMLIQQLCTSYQASADRFYKTLYESLLDPRLITSSKQSLYLNLLYRALKADVNVKRVKAFTKRILQILALHQPSFICGSLFLLQELMQAFPGLSALIDQPEEHDADDEICEDVQELEDKVSLPRKSRMSQNSGRAYDGRKRDPEYSNAENSCLWEVVPFSAHFHPSVSVSAEHILRHAKLPGKPNLELHTLIHFLDRFAYRNAKLGSSNLRGSSIMQPLAGGDSMALLVSPASHGQLPVNSENFWSKKSTDIPADDAFFHRYFNCLGKATEASETRKKARKIGSDDDASENEESEIWKAMMESAPDLEGADESDQGLGMSDLESNLEESSDEGREDDEADAEEVALLSDELSALSDDEVPLAEKRAERISEHDPSAIVPFKRTGKGQSARRRKLKHLPTFASANDYAKMINDEEGEDVG